MQRPRFSPYDRFLCSQSLRGFVRNQGKVSQAYERSVSKKQVHTKQTMLPFVLRNTQCFFRVITQTDFNSDHTIDFCVVKVFMVLLETKIKFLNVSFCCWKRTTFPFVVRNKQQGDYHFSDKKFSFLLPIYKV